MATFVIKADLSIEELRSRIGDAVILPVSRLAVVEHVGEEPALCRKNDNGTFTPVLETEFYSFADADRLKDCPKCGLVANITLDADGMRTCSDCGGRFSVEHAVFLKGDKKQ